MEDNKKAHAESVFRNVVDTLGVNAVGKLMQYAEDAIREGDSGVLVTDGEEDGATLVTLGIGADFVDFAHADDERGGMYALPLQDATSLLEAIKTAKEQQ